MPPIKQSINLVWMKRDLRTQDHEPMMLAEKAGIPYFIVFCFEPSLMAHPDTSVRHLQFQYQSLLQVNEKLKPSGRCVEIFYRESLEVFSWISQHFDIQQIFSYRESGIRLTWQRDKAVKRWCNTVGISWSECKRDGIQRGIRNREGWDKQWFGFMNAPIIRNYYTPQSIVLPDHSFIIPEKTVSAWSDYPRDFQPAGEDVAFRYLQSFVETRGINYNKHI